MSQYNTREIDVFVHIPKTAGSTIRSIINKQFKGHIFYFEPNSQTDQNEHYNYLRHSIKNNTISLIMGHYPFGVHELICKPCRYFSFLRNPIDRAMSEYFYASQYDMHPHADGIRSGKIKIDEYLLSDSFVQHNAQCMMIAGINAERENALRQAKNAIDACYHFCGIAESFDRDVILLSSILKWTPPIYLSRNATRYTEEMLKIRHSILATRGKELNIRYKDDIDLWRYVDSINATKRISAGSAFAEFYSIFHSAKAELMAKYDTQYGEYNVNDVEDVCLSNDVTDLSRKLSNDSWTKLVTYASNERKNRALHNYIGFAESNRPTKGWVVDLYNPDKPVSVRLLSGGKFHSVVASVKRADIARLLPQVTATTGFIFNDSVGDVRVYPGSLEMPLQYVVDGVESRGHTLAPSFSLNKADEGM